MANFEVFQRSMLGLSGDPTITVHRARLLSLNGAAFLYTIAITQEPTARQISGAPAAGTALTSNPIFAASASSQAEKIRSIALAPPKPTTAQSNTLSRSRRLKD